MFTKIDVEPLEQLMSNFVGSKKQEMPLQQSAMISAMKSFQKTERPL